MTTWWAKRWNWGRWWFDLTFDLCDVMIGIAWGERDIVIKPVPFVVLVIEKWEEE